MRAYPRKIARRAAGKRAKFVRVDRSLPGLAFAEAAFLRLHRAKQINGPVAPRMNATQKRTSSKREGNSGDMANSVNASLKVPSSRRSQIPHLRRWIDQGAGGHAEDAGTLLVFESIALTTDVDGGRVVEQAVDDGGSGDLVSENSAPLGVGLVRGDDDAALGVALGDELEQETGRDLVQGQVSHLVEDEQGRHAELDQSFTETVFLNVAGELVEQLGDGDEVDG